MKIVKEQFDRPSNEYYVDLILSRGDIDKILDSALYLKPIELGYDVINIAIREERRDEYAFEEE